MTRARHRPAAPQTYWRGKLSPTQAAVAELVAQGLSNDGIAARLGVTQQTIKFHLSDSFKRLGLVNRVELARWWIETVELAEAIQHASAASRQQIRSLAESCAWEEHGYRVPVAPGQELATIQRRLDVLERHCRSYARSVSTLHRRLDVR